MLPQTVRKLLHQHLIDLLHSQKAIAVSLLTLILLIISILQFSDTVLEWSVDKYRVLQHTYSSSDNLLGKSFERQLCYTAPIDVVYTWVNGTDPWHQAQLEKYQFELQREIFRPGNQGMEVTPEVVNRQKNRRDQQNHVSRVSDAQCGSSHCIQAKAILITPSISLPDLSEVFNNISLPEITAYTLVNQTLALTPEFFDLDDLLEERFLLVNDREFSFHSVHLTVKTDAGMSECRIVDFARMVTGVREEISREEVERAFPSSLRLAIRSADFYRTKSVAVVYFDSNSINLKDLDAVKAIEVNGDLVELTRVCLLEDIQPSASDNEIRLSRFKDNEELRYSIRSLEKHAGWIRRIFIVTNGQVPSWLNMENSKVEIVTHEQIFLNQSHLPTFSSSAIEAHLHRIPGLSEKFLYFNDDVLLARNVLPEDFFSQSEGYKVHLSWHVPACADGCPAGWINDGFCDATCNNAMCNFDGGDCVNKTVSLDLEGDEFDPKSFRYTEACHPGCMQAWLADRYCDTVCNHAECGFDAGDCGLDKLARFPHFSLKSAIHEYSTPPGAVVVVFNASNLFLDRNVTLTEGTYHQAKGVRTVSVYPKRNAIIALFYTNVTGSTTFTLSFAEPGDKTSDQLKYDFLVHFDSSAATATAEMNTEEKAEEHGMTAVTFPPVPENLRGPHPVFAENLVRPFYGNLSVAQLSDMFHAGDLTEFGFERRKAAFLGVTMDSSITRPFVRSRATPLTSTTTLVLEGHDEATSTISARRNERLFPSTTRKGNFGSKTAKNGPKFKDAYADSLRYVNRLYNDVFGIQQRKVPAHVPHFVDRTVMEELQLKFPVEFDLTSGTRVRSPQDMQFAFSFFHYIMSVQADIEMSEIFDEIDTDHSGTWNQREVDLAAIRGSEDYLSEAQLQAFRMTVQSCAFNASNETPSPISDQSSSEKTFSVTKQTILACEPVRRGLLAQLGRRNRFRFRTTTDMEAFTFIRVGINASLVRKQLQEFLRHPKKFICLNDEVDYTRKDSVTIQAAVRSFFETLYPVPSSFELPPGVRNPVTHIKDLQALQCTYQLFRMAVFTSFVVVVLIFCCILFPRRRRLVFRRVRLWMRNRDIDRAMILHT